MKNLGLVRGDSLNDLVEMIRLAVLLGKLCKTHIKLTQ